MWWWTKQFDNFDFIFSPHFILNIYNNLKFIFGNNYSSVQSLYTR